jgi:hypothetical protein
MNGCGSQQRPVSHPELRTLDLSAQDRKFVPQDQQFDVFHVQAAAATNESAQQRPNGEVEEREGHAADPPSRLVSTRHIGALHPADDQPHDDDRHGCERNE